MILKPPKIEKGRTIGIVGPASPMKPSRLTKGIEYIEKCGYRVKTGQHVYDVHGYLGGSDKGRAGDINQMFSDSEIQGIFCTRGGYGTPRIVELIDYEAVKKNPKVFVGFSDITALQLALFRKIQLVTFSGPMAAVEMGKGIDPFTESNFWNVVTTAGSVQKIETLNCLKPGTVEGRLLGGTLSMICALIGTPYLPDFQNAILFLEDVGEEPYRIDRKLMQLKLAGILAQVNGIVFGKFEGCDSKSQDPSLTVDQVIDDVLADLDVPAVTGLRYGHVDVKHTLPIGVNAYLNANEGYLDILEPPVV